MKFSSCFPIVALLAMTASLLGCGGKGSSAAAPTGLSVAGEDNQITMSWDVVPGVQYRVYCAPGTSIDNGWSTWMPVGPLGGTEITGTQNTALLPPYTVTNLQNGLQWACTVDGRYDNGPAGPSAPSRATVTRPVATGVGWQPALDTGMGSSFRAVAAGTLSGLTPAADKFFAVDAQGRLRVSDSYKAGGSWTDVAVPTTLGSLNTAIVYGGRLYVAGSGGVVAYTLDLQNWTTSANLGAAINKIVSNNNQYPSNGNRLVAVGASGLIMYSADGSNWSRASISAISLPDLQGVTYSEAGYWVAVGRSGTVLLSSDAGASSWSVTTSAVSPSTWPSAHLNSVAALKVQTPNTTPCAACVYKLVAVGANGTVGYSSDGRNWSWQSVNNGSTDITQVVASNQTLVQIDTANQKTYSYAGGQFMMAGAGGKVWVSGDALNWNNSTWSDISAWVGTTADAVSLLRYVKLETYNIGETYAYTWLLYGADGTGRFVR